MEGEGIENTEKTNTKEKYLRRIGFRFGEKVTIYL
jgi:hypothetical protein